MTSEKRECGAVKPEITPEMIRAGRRAFYAPAWNAELDEEAVARIYRAMEEARFDAERKYPSQDSGARERP